MIPNQKLQAFSLPNVISKVMLACFYPTYGKSFFLLFFSRFQLSDMNIDCVVL